MMLNKIRKEIGRIKKKLVGVDPKQAQLDELKSKIDNLPYEFYDQFKQGVFEVQIPHVKSIEETLDRIITDHCSISRFGDGEFACMNLSRIAFHDASDVLAKRLKEVMASDRGNLLIGLPDCFGSLDRYVPYTQKFWRKWMSKKRQLAYSFLDMDKIYYNAFFNRCYLNYNKTDGFYEQCSLYFEQLKEIWKGRDIVLLEGEQERLGVGNDLFDGANSISRILFRPVRNSFNKYDQILSSFQDINSDSLVLASLGPTATVLAYDLCREGYQAIDFGHISEEYEAFLRKETPMEQMSEGRDFNMKHEADPSDPEYKNQIVKIIY